jgi:tetratricopeptide (TPR) repeat protein
VYREILRIKPDDVPSRTELGRLLVKRGDEASLRDAEALYRKAIALDDRQLAPRTELGRLLAKRGDADGAEKVYREILKIDRDNIPARHEWGRLLERLGRERSDPEKLRKAKTLYEEILARDKLNDGARKGLARLRDV